MPWKEFEQLVSNLEIMFSDQNCRVKHNDQVRDKYGSLRQVDATVRFSTGATNYLTIIECRNRKKVSDSIWIEQIATKRDNLGADKAICVSNKPLSSPARLQARDRRIDVRTLETLSESFNDYLEPWMEFGNAGWHSERIGIGFTDEDSQAQFSEYFGNIDANELTFLILGRTWNAQSLYKAALRECEKIDIPPKTKEVRRSISFFEEGTPSIVCHLDKKFEVTSINVEMVYQFKQTPLNSSFKGMYTSTDSTIDHIVHEASVTHNGNDLRFRSTKASKSETFSFNVPFEFLDEDARQGVDPERGVTLTVDFDEKGNPTINSKK